MQLGQGFGLFFLPGGRPRPRRGADSSRGSVFGVMMVSRGDSGSGSVGNRAVVAGGSGTCVSCMRRKYVLESIIIELFSWNWRKRLSRSKRVCLKQVSCFTTMYVIK